MKKSKIIILASLAFVIALFVTCFLIYNSLFPKAPPIEVPSLDQDMKITVSYPDGSQEELFREGSFTACRSFINVLMRAKPTRIISTNDYPAGEEYTKISYECSDKTYTYYVYKNNETMYVEIPYVGVYTID